MARRKKNKFPHKTFGIVFAILFCVVAYYQDEIYTWAYKNEEIYTIDDIPAYDGASYIVLNNNEPVFNKEDINETSFEEYSPLDNLGRCGAAYANIGIDLMPTEERGSIGMIKPTL